MAGKTGKPSLDETVSREMAIKPLKPEHQKAVRKIYAGIDGKRSKIAAKRKSK